MEVRVELAYDKPKAIIDLFTEYTDSIMKQGPDVVSCLASQHYDDELQELQNKYGLPDGRLYLAFLGDEAVGCVALRKLDDSSCEMKRLYVKTGYRGKRIGKALVEQVIEAARQTGYRQMCLDTFQFMEDAIKIYRQYGFYEIERYNDNPATTAVFMQLDL